MVATVNQILKRNPYHHKKWYGFAVFYIKIPLHNG
ncbi:hypothetical protein Desca_0568 [Desulfotomaculum nigrificans CO-1-SRB]|uniref:Uncharacterized protein n=1 Tax=Desulfotomaculum nigrificans (strain DSM 14880 / VKM B-2319 / CO-1-SRB) TaxID=868595 RepID=F6B7T6_DESCC|nr:hypothetical protein Desca_0568 [Desulfotomaculum nigrificans CO-1-SRB]